jgi:NAD-dependent dihydropyrimidine dehydrogenase PreA subunit
MAVEETGEELEKELEGVKAVTIPVNFCIEGKHKVLDLSELETIFRNATVISQGECHCRKEMGDDKCREPMDGCFGIDDFAKDAIEKWGEKKTTVEEALEAMERTHDAGLVHMVYSFKGKEEPDIVCSCCSCCCGLLGVAAKIGFSDHVFESKFISTHDDEACQSCGTCGERCQFGARKILDDFLVYEKDKCFGCGVCVGTCPQDAIAMAERPA